MTWAQWWRRVAAIYGALGILLGCARSAPTAAPDYSHTPVLFVHGSGLDSSTWEDIIAHLISLGYPSEYLLAVDIVPNDMANVQAATTAIAPAVESLLAYAPVAAKKAGHHGQVPRRLDIVSHSMGAVSSRWYTAKLHPELVRTWIALAGANHGTNALCGHSGEGNKEMCPAFAPSAQSSAVQVALNGTPGSPSDETPYGLGADRAEIPRIPPDGTRSILYLTVRIEPDRWIKPESSAMLDGAGGRPVAVPTGVPVKESSPGNYLFRGGVGHDPLPQHPDLIRFVAAMLAVRDAESASK